MIQLKLNNANLCFLVVLFLICHPNPKHSHFKKKKKRFWQLFQGSDFTGLNKHPNVHFWTHFLKNNLTCLIYKNAPAHLKAKCFLP